MVPYKNAPLKIVRSYSGQGTAETIYEAEDGSIWKADSSNHSNETAPPRMGRICDNVILPR